MVRRPSRTLALVGLAMVMFTVGVIVWVAADNLADHLLAGVAILGAAAVILTNVNGHDQ